MSNRCLTWSVALATPLWFLIGFAAYSCAWGQTLTVEPSGPGHAIAGERASWNGPTEVYAIDRTARFLAACAIQATQQIIISEPCREAMNKALKDKP